MEKVTACLQHYPVCVSKGKQRHTGLENPFFFSFFFLERRVNPVEERACQFKHYRDTVWSSHPAAEKPAGPLRKGFRILGRCKVVEGTFSFVSFKM